MTDKATAGDLLSAASVLAGVLSFLYANVYSRVRAGLDIERGERQPSDLKKERRRIEQAAWQAVAAGAVALALGAIFAPRIVDLVRDGHIFDEYDPIALSLAVVWLLFVGVALHAASSAWRLRRKHGELS